MIDLSAPSSTPPQGRCPRWVLLAWALGFAALAGCTSWSNKDVQVYQRETFDSNETFSRLFDANVSATCEAAQRTLLSQGYVLGTVRPGFVAGAKSFQPDPETHVQILFNVVCSADGKEDRLSTAYVSATQDRYAIKKSASSATVGISALGSLSLPMGSTDDAMVKVASETIPAGPFYDRFFALMRRNLRDQQNDTGSAGDASVAGR